MEKAGYGKDGIFRSLRPPLILPMEDEANIVSFLFRDSSPYAHKLALVDADSGEKLCFGKFKDKVYQVGAGLHQLGIKNQDVVLIFAPNSINFPLCFFGIISIGAVATTVNPLYTTKEVSKQVHDSKTKLIITVPALWDKIKDLGLPAVIIGSYNLSMSTSGIPITLFSEVLNMGLKEGPPMVRFKQTDIAALLYSSGTTGTSKGVVLSHRNFIASVLMLGSDQEARGEKNLTWLSVLPMFHAYGLVNVMTAQLQRKNTVVSMGRYDFVWMLKVIQEYKVTHLPIVPPIMIALAKHKDIVAQYDLSFLKEVITGAAPLGRDIIEECAANIPNAVILQGYGLTETCGIATMVARERKGHFGSSGTLVSGIEAKIASLEIGKPLPPNQRGEIWLRGSNIMAGYFNNPNATKDTMDRDGWLHTGDLGFFDENGNLFIVDRIKELIKCKGFQVAPAELEGLLLTHPEIVDAAVIPQPDPQAGEVPIAYIVLSSGSSLKKQDVMEFVSKQVAPFKRLHNVIFVKVIPKSASGKILRRELVKNMKSKL
ncbi:hypothetical protein SUGI_0839160 [Cryptomeria japonica]|uniref:probable CoA ligase CCL7 isoform X2 n=1 Tax=Cryptomeria japonica TaxID=3369 RepID=UPI002414878D|nr:probable CoA ligase CCL7 isoform X2 [Cryptomeria japonica]GLJ40646.1 hypothetical protein SUGI_0839160 [Cryptomeria japonica]